MYSSTISYFHTHFREGNGATEKCIICPKLYELRQLTSRTYYLLNHHTPLSPPGTERVSTVSGNNVKLINASY